MQNYLKKFTKYQPSDTWGNAAPIASPHCLQNQKWPLGTPKMSDRFWKCVNTTKVFGRSCQLLLNKFLEPSTPSMRKVDNEGEEQGRCMFQSIIKHIWVC